MEIVLIRHGESEGNARQGGELVFTGQWDCPLTEEGYRQARQLAGDPVFSGAQAFYVSDLRRAIETARAITDNQLIIDPRLRERSLGEFEGRREQEIMADPRYQRWFTDPQYMPFRQSFSARSPGGENYTDVCQRVHPFLDELRQSGYRKVVIVAHYCVIQCLAKHILELDEEETKKYPVYNCRPIVIEWN